MGCGKKSVVRVAQVPVAMRPVKTLKSLLVHPKDKQDKEEITDCVYKISCASCEKCYIGETGRKFGTRLKEHKTEVESITSKPFTRDLAIFDFHDGGRDGQEVQNASSCQISSISVKPRPRYGNFLFFKMAAAAILDFRNFNGRNG